MMFIITTSLKETDREMSKLRLTLISSKNITTVVFFPLSVNYLKQNENKVSQTKKSPRNKNPSESI